MLIKYCWYLYNLYLKSNIMPPKKGAPPKLTKKQKEEEKREAARLQKQKEQEEAEAQRQRLAEEQRIRQKQRKKILEEERIRIVGEKQKKYPQLQQRMKSENQALKKLRSDENWEKFTNPYYKNYSIQGTSLSTFATIFQQTPYKNPKETLELCEQSQIYITKLEEKLLEHRTNYQQQLERQCSKSIEVLKTEQLKKLEEIMIEYVNSAEQIEEKNVEEVKKKNEANTTQKQPPLTYSIANMTDNFKIGMYLYTYSTKNLKMYVPIQIQKFGFKSGMPIKWASNLVYVKFQWNNFNQFVSQKKEDFRIVGGVYNLEFYEIPPPTKKASTIMIRKNFKGKDVLTKFKLSPSAIVKETITVTYELPHYVFMAPYKYGNKDNLKIAQFDTSAQKWNLIPSNSIKYPDNSYQIVCEVPKPEPIALVENICADYPYIAWELRTVEAGKILLDFELKRTIASENDDKKVPLMLQFEIGPNVVKLEMNDHYQELQDLCQNYFPPESILNQLSKRGIHLLPGEEDYQYANIPKKDRQAEKNAIRDIAYAVESFTVRSEPNDSSDIRVKIRENLDNQNIFLEDQEKDWKKIRWGDRDKCWVDNRGVQQRHMNLQVLLEEHQICEKECVERMKYDKSYLLRKTLMKVLQLTRVLAFTTADCNQESQLVAALKDKITIQ